MEKGLCHGRGRAVTSGPDFRDSPGAPEPGTVLGPADAITETQSGVFTFGLDVVQFEMFVLCHHGKLVAYVNHCPHVQSPLDWKPGEFLNKDRTYILCTMHGAEFEIATGRCVDGPCRGEYLTRVPIEVQGGMVYVT